MKRIMTLGELITTLERKVSGCEACAEIRFDFVYFRPTHLHSWRGDYSQLALGYSKEGTTHASDLLTLLQDAEGKDFTGYKGGEYTATRGKVIFVAEANEVGSTGIVDVKEYCGDLILETAHFND